MAEEEKQKKYILAAPHPLGEPAVPTLNRAINWGAPSFELGAADITREGIQAVKELSQANKMKLTYHIPSYTEQQPLELMVPELREESKRFLDMQLKYAKDIGVTNVVMHPTTKLQNETPESIIGFNEIEGKIQPLGLPEDFKRKAEYLAKQYEEEKGGKKDWRDAYEEVKLDYIKTLNEAQKRKLKNETIEFQHHEDTLKLPQYGGGVLDAKKELQKKDINPIKFFSAISTANQYGNLSFSEKDEKIYDGTRDKLRNLEEYRDQVGLLQAQGAPQERIKEIIEKMKGEEEGITKNIKELSNSLKPKIMDRASYFEDTIKTTKEQYKEYVRSNAEFLPKKFLDEIKQKDPNVRIDINDNAWDKNGNPVKNVIDHRLLHTSKDNTAGVDPLAIKFADEFTPFAEKAIKDGITVGLENMDRRFYGSSPEFMKDMMKRIEDNLRSKNKYTEEQIKKHIGVTFDYGHANTMCEFEAGGKKYGLKDIKSPEEYAEKMGQNIVHVHYSENWGDTDAHLPVGRTTQQGQDYDEKLKNFTKYLRDKGYEGPLVSEGFLAQGVKELHPVAYREAALHSQEGARVPNMSSPYIAGITGPTIYGPSTSLDPLHPDKKKEGYFFSSWAGDLL